MGMLQLLSLRPSIKQGRYLRRFPSVSPVQLLQVPPNTHLHRTPLTSKSSTMRVLSLVPVVVGLLATAEAHTTVYGVWINGVRIGVLQLVLVITLVLICV